MQRIDDKAAEAYWKIALAGQGGTGKTSMGVSAPQPLILLSERQGLPSIKLAAKRLGVPVPPVLLVESAEDYRAAHKALRGPKDKPFIVKSHGEVVMELPVEQWPQTAVIDSLSDACDVLVAEIRKQSPQQTGRDGLPVDAKRFWAVLIDRATLLIKAFRDLPMHVVFLCLVNDKMKEDGNGNVIGRLITPKLATANMSNSLCAAVNVMAYTYRTLDKERGVVYGAQTIGPEGMMTKPCEPLRRHEVADLGSWIARLCGNLENVPEAPLPPEDMEPPSETKSDPPKEESPEASKDGTFRCTQCSNEVSEEGVICADCDERAFGNSDTPTEPAPAPEAAPAPDRKKKVTTKKAAAKPRKAKAS